MNHDDMTNGAPATPTTEELAEFLNQATSEGRNFYYEGQHDAEDEADAASRLALVHERDALRLMATWAYGKLISRTFNSMDDALELDRLKLYVEHGVVD